MAQGGANGVFPRHNNQGQKMGQRNQGYKAEVNEVTPIMSKTTNEVSTPQTRIRDNGVGTLIIPITFYENYLHHTIGTNESSDEVGTLIGPILLQKTAQLHNNVVR
ncbi:hypothetical protein Fot_06400 [Forsythia ovata]|uniref:Reverse transcriptase domain-containing protein n=1 Tax=Forsythia ovata TaxID=205694 RepID=A0ABD1WSU8_9LAMI